MKGAGFADRQAAARISEMQASATTYPADQAVVMAQRRIEKLSAQLVNHPNPKTTNKWQELGMLKGLIKGTEILRAMDIEVTIFPSELDNDKGKPVVQIDTMEMPYGPIRINLNDGGIWDGNPEDEGPPSEDPHHAARLNKWNSVGTEHLTDGTTL